MRLRAIIEGVGYSGRTISIDKDVDRPDDIVAFHRADAGAQERVEDGYTLVVSYDGASEAAENIRLARLATTTGKAKAAKSPLVDLVAEIEQTPHADKKLDLFGQLPDIQELPEIDELRDEVRALADSGHTIETETGRKTKAQVTQELAQRIDEILPKFRALLQRLQTQAAQHDQEATTYRGYANKKRVYKGLNKLTQHTRNRFDDGEGSGREAVLWLIKHGIELAAKKFKEISARTGRQRFLVIPVPSSRNSYNIHMINLLASQLGADPMDEILKLNDEPGFNRTNNSRLTNYPDDRPDSEIMKSGIKMSAIARPQRKNVTDRFKLGPEALDWFKYFSDAIIIVVDDSIFTGSTMKMCLKCVGEGLRELGLDPHQMLYGYGLIGAREPTKAELASRLS